MTEFVFRFTPTQIQPLKNTPVNSSVRGPILSTLDFEKDGAEIRKSLLSRESIELVKSDINLESKKLKKYGVRNLEKRFRARFRTFLLERTRF